ncbi:unnamed protein product [Haemonchus placei]|uniref:AN1-type domain-containing protein n=1 Tax=Haemonchus placei TaxID=6290 RepID=A0A0N4WI18_HAEPC|nr:unnamed protein product [Haemonchus placei]
MAELPNLGRHCGRFPLLQQMNNFFLMSDFQNVQVPTCPLCDKPVPTPKGVSPDIQVDQHIQNNCAQGPKKKIFANRCTVKGCKKKELVPITCPSCHQNFCLGHRHEKDHNCSQTKGSPQISEDEALARALAASMDDVNISPEERDRRLAEQLQAQEYGLVFT